jgi:hypothetical protein
LSSATSNFSPSPGDDENVAPRPSAALVANLTKSASPLSNGVSTVVVARTRLSRRRASRRPRTGDAVDTSTRVSTRARSAARDARSVATDRSRSRRRSRTDVISANASRVRRRRVSTSARRAGASAPGRRGDDIAEALTARAVRGTLATGARLRSLW